MLWYVMKPSLFVVSCSHGGRQTCVRSADVIDRTGDNTAINPMPFKRDGLSLASLSLSPAAAVINLPLPQPESKVTSVLHRLLWLTCTCPPANSYSTAALLPMQSAVLATAIPSVRPSV